MSSQQRKTYKNHLKRFNNGASNSAELASLAEMFADWDADELAGLLAENNNDVEVVIDLIINGKVAKWEPIKKEKKVFKKDVSSSSDEPASSHTLSLIHI